MSCFHLLWKQNVFSASYITTCHLPSQLNICVSHTCFSRSPCHLQVHVYSWISIVHILAKPKSGDPILSFQLNLSRPFFWLCPFLLRLSLGFKKQWSRENDSYQGKVLRRRFAFQNCWLGSYQQESFFRKNQVHTSILYGRSAHTPPCCN